MQPAWNIESIEQLRAIKVFEFRGLGQHVLADYRECKSIPTRANELERLMVNSAKRATATIVTTAFHEFSPQGLSGVVVIAESHFAAHTWPEHRAVCVDLFTCSKGMAPLSALVYLFEQLEPCALQLSVVQRG